MLLEQRVRGLRRCDPIAERGRDVIAPVKHARPGVRVPRAGNRVAGGRECIRREPHREQHVDPHVVDRGVHGGRCARAERAVEGGRRAGRVPPGKPRLRQHEVAIRPVHRVGDRIDRSEPVERTLDLSGFQLQAGELQLSKETVPRVVIAANSCGQDALRSGVASKPREHADRQLGGRAPTFGLQRLPREAPLPVAGENP